MNYAVRIHKHAVARGTDAEWRTVLRESFATEFVPLSHVFATILAYCKPSDLLLLWDENKSLFVSDI